MIVKLLPLAMTCLLAANCPAGEAAAASPATRQEPAISNRERWKRMKYGFFVHYVWDGGKEATPIRADGSKPKSIDELADGFDAPGFARDLTAMGVEYVFFTAWHSGNFPLYPSAVADRVSGKPRSPKRDLLGDMIDACHAAGIRVLFYTHPEQAIDWTRDWHADQAEGFAELVERYGSRIDGLFLDENNPEGRMDPKGNRFQNLERIIKRRNPDLVTVQNFFGNLYGTDGVMYEWGGQPGADPMNWGAASASPIAHTMASGWIAQKPPGVPTMLYTGEGIFRFTVMMAGSCVEGGGIAWATGPYVGGGWETGVMEEMTKAGRYIAPVAESIKNTCPSRSYPTQGGTKIGDLAWGVATRSPDDKTEYLHVLKPQPGKVLQLPLPADGKVFANARLLPSKHPVALVSSENGLRLTLSEGDSWDRLDTVIAMDAICPGGRALINDNDASIAYSGSSWQHLCNRNLGEYGNDVHTATADGDSFAIRFDGTEIQIISSRSADRGTVDVFLDGTLRQSVDMSANPNPRTVVFSASGLPTGRHVLKAVKRGGKVMNLDAVQVSELINDNDPRISYLSTYDDKVSDPAKHPNGFITYSPGQWQSNRDITGSQQMGAWFTIDFHGTGVIMRGTGVGAYDFFLDDQFVRRVDMTASGQHHAIGIDLAGLKPGRHVLKGVMVGGPYVHVDTFSIYGCKDADWTRGEVAGMGCLGNDMHSTRNQANLIHFDFEGTDLDLLAPTSEKLGTVQYIIDGKVAKIGTQYAGEPTQSGVLFSCHDYLQLSPGKHSFRMQLHRGEQMQFDAIRVFKKPENLRSE